MVLWLFQVMILGSSTSTANATAGAVSRPRKRQVQAFNHYCSGAGTWVGKTVISHKMQSL